MPNDNPQTALEEHLAAAQNLITEACYMADKKMGRERREHWIDNFAKKLAEYEARYDR